MAKITAELIAEAAALTGIPELQRSTLLSKLAMLMESMGVKEVHPPTKKRFVFLVADPDHRLRIAGFDKLAGWVVQIPEADADTFTSDRIAGSAHAFNSTDKGKAKPVQTIGEALESVPRSIMRDSAFWCRTRHPVCALPVDGEIPHTAGLLEDGNRGNTEQLALTNE